MGIEGALASLAVNNFSVFLLVLVRVAGIFVFAPLLSSSNIPYQVKIFFSGLVALALFPMVKSVAPVPVEILPYSLLILQEIFVGFVIGYAVIFVFAGIQMGGQLVAFAMGFSIVDVMDPVNHASVSVISQIKYITAVIVFFAINGHHWLFQALYKSYELLPIGGMHFNWYVLQKIILMSGDIFVIAIKISAPVVVSLMLINAALGIVARTVPQMNVFIVGLPLQIGIGLVMLTFSMSIFVYVVRLLLGSLPQNIVYLLHAMKG